MKALALVILFGTQVMAGQGASEDSLQFREDIRKVILDHKDDIKDCFEETLKTNPNAEGKIVLSWEFDGGKVTEGSMKSGPKELAGTSDCIIKKLKTWKFPENKGHIANVSYPFVFMKQE